MASVTITTIHSKDPSFNSQSERVLARVAVAEVGERTELVVDVLVGPASHPRPLRLPVGTLSLLVAVAWPARDTPEIGNQLRRQDRVEKCRGQDQSRSLEWKTAMTEHSQTLPPG